MNNQPTRESFTALRKAADETYFAIVAAEKANAPVAELAQLHEDAHRAHRALLRSGFKVGSPDCGVWSRDMRLVTDKYRDQARKLRAQELAGLSG